MPKSDQVTEWKVGGTDGSTSSDKITYVKPQRTSDSMTAGQKEGVRVWNLMRQTLLDHGLMEDK